METLLHPALTRTYCGLCSKPVASHFPGSSDDYDFLPEELESFDEDTCIRAQEDYVPGDFTYPYMEATDYSGDFTTTSEQLNNGSFRSAAEDAWFENTHTELVSDSYYDRYPDEHTHILNVPEWVLAQRHNHHIPFVVPEQAKVHAAKEASTSLKYEVNFRPHSHKQMPEVSDLPVHYDDHLTELLHNRFLNIFRGYKGELRMGGLVFDNYEGQVGAKCTFTGCAFTKRPYLASPEPTREEMEEFVVACIKHSNNHGPKWWLDSERFYPIHAVNCDASHEFNEACNALAPRLSPATLNDSDAHEVHRFLQEHMQHCRNTKCKCAHYESLLWEVTHKEAV